MPSAARDLAALPKAHLHLHLEGGMRPTTLRELATGNGIPVPEIRGFGTFGAFAATYVAACDVLISANDVARLVDETVDDAAAAGAVHVEPGMFLPHHRARLGSDEQVLEVVLDAMAAASARTGVSTGLMVSADRTRSPEDAVEQARLAARYAGRGVVAFGLANNEDGHPPEPFAEAFGIARSAGLLSTPHAGELDGPASVRGAIEVLGADRILHGVRAVEDPALVQQLAQSEVCLDVCPTSNLMLSVVDDLAAHPLPALLDAGVRCSLGADDPLLFGPGLLEEYELCRDTLGLSDAQLAAVARSSLTASGASPEVVADGLAGVAAWLATA